MPLQVSPSWAAAALVVASLAACAGSSAGEGALGPEGGRVTSCTPLAGTGPVVFADETLENVSTHPLTVEKVRLVEPDGLRLLDAFLLPVVNRTLLGTVALPPTNPVWSQRQKAVGAELAPGETWNLALTLDREKPSGSFVDVEVAYTAGGDSATHRVGWSSTILAAPPC